MKKNLLLFLLLAPALMAGCAMSSLLPGADPTVDPNIGAGKGPVQAATAPAVPAVVPAASTPTLVLVPQVIAQPTAVLPPTAVPPPTQPPASGAPGLAPGGSFQQGDLTFTLVQVQADAENTQVSFTVQGLPEGYTPSPDAGDPRIELAGGQELNTISGGGGVLSGKLSGVYTFPALPAGTRNFTLVVTNNWSGQLTVWKIPMRINP